MFEFNWKCYSVDLQKELRRITKQYIKKWYPLALELGDKDPLTTSIDSTIGANHLYSKWQITYKEYVISDKTIDEIIKYGLDSLSRNVLKQISEMIKQQTENEDSIGRVCICYSIPLTAYESEKNDPLKLTIVSEAEISITWVV